MNQPTREEFDALAEEVRKIKERQTEPITIPRIELDPSGIQNRLDNHAEMMRELSQQSDRHTQAFVRVETILGEHGRQLENLVHQSIRTQTDVSRLRERVESIEQKVDGLSQTVEKRFDAIVEVQKLILARLPEKGE